MKKFSTILLISILALFLTAGSSFALTIAQLGQEITIYDGLSGTGDAWWNTTNENDETEPNTLTGDAWDFEAMYLDKVNNTLTVLAGFNFATGAGPSNNYDLGDIFIDTDYNTGNGYTYALDLDRDSNGKLNQSGGDVYSGNYTWSNPTYKLESTPYQYTGGGTDVGDISYSTGQLTDTGQYYLQLAADNSQNFTLAHMTMSCGNDMIKGSPVPEPATMILFGAGLIGLAGIGRKKMFVK